MGMHDKLNRRSNMGASRMGMSSLAFTGKDDLKISTIITNNAVAAQRLVLTAPLLIGILASQDDNIVNINGVNYIGVMDGNTDVSEEKDESETLVVATQRAPFQQAMRYLAVNGGRINHLKLTSKSTTGDKLPNQTQFNNPLVHEVYNPLSVKKNVEIIAFDEALDQYQVQPGVLDVQDGFTIDENSIVTLTIEGKTSLALTMYIGALINKGKGLEKLIQENGLFPKQRKRFQG
jgi:hypothetical protein